jgi:hypothetical protein
MVSTQKEDTFRVINFKSHDEGNDFDRVDSPIDIVSQEKDI